MKVEPMWRRIQRLLGPDIGADVEDELRHHLEMRTRDLERAGMPAEEARAEALRRFGDVATIRAEVESIERKAERRERRSQWFGDLGQDLTDRPVRHPVPEAEVHEVLNDWEPVGNHTGLTADVAREELVVDEAILE